MPIVIGADIRTDGSELERDMRRDARVIERRMGNAFKSVGRIASTTFKGIAVAGNVLGRALLNPLRALTSLQGIVGVALGGLGADRLIRNATALELRTKTLAKQLEVTERVAGRLISRINAASAGMLDFAKASELANQAGILDVPTDKLEKLVKVFTLLAVARGRQDSIGSDLEELLNSIARGEPPKRFGIFVGAEELQGLDLAGKQALTLRRTLEELDKRATRLGLTGNELFLAYNGIFGNIKDIVGEVGRWIIQLDGVGTVIRDISELTGNILSGIQSGNGKDIVGAILVSIRQVGPAITSTLGNLLEKGFKLGAAALLDILGTLDFAALGKSVAAAIGRGIQAIAPRLAQIMGIDDKTLAAAESASGNVLQRTAAGLRASAGDIDTLGPLRNLYGDVLERFRPTKEARSGDLTGLGLQAVDPGRITPDQINAAKQRLKAPFAERFNRVLQSLLTDPEIAGKFENEPSSRAAIRKRAQKAAQAELSADKALASLGSPGQIARITKAQEEIEKNPVNADLRRKALEGQVLAGLSEEQRNALESFNKRASTDPAQFDPLGIARQQLGVSPGTPLLSLLLRAGGFLGGGFDDLPETASAADPTVNLSKKGKEAQRELEEQNAQLEEQNELMKKNTDSMSKGFNLLSDLSIALDQFVSEME